MAKVLISGGTGLVGTKLTELLIAKGHKVAILSRKPNGVNQFYWNIQAKEIDKKAFEGVTHIIHLAGAGIADKRWNDERKKVLINSRVATASLLLEKVKEYQISLKGFVSASGIGYYGAITNDKKYVEEDNPHTDFISKICVDWENEAMKFSQINVPVTILRTGIVLSSRGGALQKMNTPLFLSALGSGNQSMPWIHINDLCEMYLKAVEDSSFSGVYNAVAPEEQTNSSFVKTLGRVLHKPVTPFNIPSFVMKLFFGELSCILLKGSPISSKKILEHYSFKYQYLTNALEDVFKK